MSHACLSSPSLDAMSFQRIGEMLRKSSSPLIGWVDTAACVACRSDLCVMPTSRSRAPRIQLCSLCLSYGLVVVVDPPPPPDESSCIS